MTQSARLVAAGVLLGGIGAFAALGFLAGVVRLDNVTMRDAGAFTASIVIIAAAAALATYYPARRAALVNPSIALRADG